MREILRSRINGLCFFVSLLLCFLVFATNFRVKAAMKNSVLLSWEIRDKNPSQPFTVGRSRQAVDLLYIPYSPQMPPLRHSLGEVVALCPRFIQYVNAHMLQLI